jgi:gliding motility-associated lipoprotein GldH
MNSIVKNTWIYLLFLGLGLQACSDDAWFIKQNNLAEGAWSQEKELVFSIPVNDSISKNDVFIILRNNNEYPYSNIYIETRMDFPDGKNIIDTLEYQMADARGNWLGTGISEVKESVLFYKEGVEFPVTGMYRLGLKPLMRDLGSVEGRKELPGIISVGLKIESQK